MILTLKNTNEQIEYAADWTVRDEIMAWADPGQTVRMDIDDGEGGSLATVDAEIDDGGRVVPIGGTTEDDLVRPFIEWAGEAIDREPETVAIRDVGGDHDFDAWRSYELR